jgi:hypothetical protein
MAKKVWHHYRSLDGGKTWEYDTAPTPRKISEKGIMYRYACLRDEFPNADVRVKQVKAPDDGESFRMNPKATYA